MARSAKPLTAGATRSAFLLETVEEARLGDGRRIPAGSKISGTIVGGWSAEAKEYALSITIDSMTVKGEKQAVPLLAVVQAIYHPGAGGAARPVKPDEATAAMANRVSEMRYTIDGGDGSALETAQTARDSSAEKRRLQETQARMAAAREYQETLRALRQAVGVFGLGSVSIWSGVVDSRGLTILKSPAEKIEFPTHTLFIVRAAK